MRDPWADLVYVPDPDHIPDLDELVAKRDTAEENES